jgi:hypothetical protein
MSVQERRKYAPEFKKNAVLLAEGQTANGYLSPDKFEMEADQLQDVV